MLLEQAHYVIHGKCLSAEYEREKYLGGNQFLRSWKHVLTIGTFPLLCYMCCHHIMWQIAVINFTVCCLTVSISVMVLFGVNPLIISYCKAKIDRGSALGSTERKRIEVLLSVQLVLSANSQVDLLTKIGRYMKRKVY